MAERGITQSRLYEWLTGDEDSRMCRGIPESACEAQPGNFFRHLIAALGNKLADELSSARLVLPWLLGAMGAPVWMVGFLVPIREAGVLLPQLLIAGYIRLKTIRKWVWMLGGLIQAACAAGLGLLALFGQGGWGGALVLAALIILSLGRGLSSIATKDVLGKTIAKQRRGNLMGWSAGMAGGVTLLAGMVLMLFEDRHNGAVLAVLLGIAALGWAVNALCAALIRETSGATQGGSHLGESLREGLRLMREDHTFLHFNLARALLLSSALALPYIALLGQQQGGGELNGLGLMIVVSGLAGMIANPLWGKRADRSSRRVMRDSGAAAAACCMAAALIAWSPGAWSHTIWPYAAAYAALMVAHAGVRLGRKTYIIDMSDEGSRALYVAMSNTVTGVLMLALGGVIGLLAQWAGSAGLLMILAIAALSAAVAAHRLPEMEG
ncbi:MFS transporter [Halomonas sp. WWR20]